MVRYNHLYNQWLIYESRAHISVLIVYDEDILISMHATRHYTLKSSSHAYVCSSFPRGRQFDSILFIIFASVGAGQFGVAEVEDVTHKRRVGGGESTTCTCSMVVRVRRRRRRRQTADV